MENNILLSIIIPLYNSERFISNLFNEVVSIKKNFYDRVEFIFVNDGSTDDTLLKIRNVFQDFENVKCVSKKNSGISGARNHGLLFANGKYVFFHDHDDSLELKNIKYILELIEELNGVDLFMFEASKVTDTNVIKLVSNSDVQYANSLQSDLLSNNLLLNLTHFRNVPKYVSRVGFIWTCIFSKKFIFDNDLKFKTFVNYEDDYLFMLEALINKPVIHLSHLNIYNWCISPTSTSSTFNFDFNGYQNIEDLHMFLNDLLTKKSAEPKKTIIDNVLWGFYYDYLVNFFQKNKVISFKLFKRFLKITNIRKPIISSKEREMKKKQVLIVLLFKIKASLLVYCLFRLKRNLKSSH